MNSKKQPEGNPKITRTILNDIRSAGLRRTLRQDFKDIYDFYIDQDMRERLSKMGRIRRWLHLAWWLLKSLFFKLAPARRILFVIAIVFFLAGRKIMQSADVQVDVNFNSLGFILLIIILMLELKDKWLAHDELSVGRAVQIALLPQKNPVLEGWDIWLYTQPANDVGGDLVDYLYLDQSRLQIALADVAGKGLGAALLMAKLQATLRALAPNFKSLGELGSQVNEILCRDGLPNRFASLVYLEIMADFNKVRLLNAGHMPPLLIRDQKIIELPKGKPALGLNKKSKYDEQKISLKSADLMIIYSDGITEAQNEQGAFWGEQRLLNLVVKSSSLSANELGKRIIAAVEQFIGDARRHDDVSLVILRSTR
ncbi:MAG: serine/threonine-protein phosphatase [bacterium]|nr:serine/threonine-protein phosphatase [bacterium]